MGNLDAIVSITISTAAAQVTREGFGLPLILSPHTKYTDLVRRYTQPSDLVADGFATSDPEYLAAQALFSQQPCPAAFLLGRRQARPAMQVDITPMVVNSKTYGLTLNGNHYSYTSDGTATAAEITAGLIAAIGAQAGLTITDATPGAGSFRIAAAAGGWFRIKVDDITLLALAQSHADPGITGDLDAILNTEDDWYSLTMLTQGKAEIMAAAAWAEANKKLMVQVSQDTANATVAEGSEPGDTTASVMHRLNLATYFRTACLYKGDNGEFADVAWLGRVLPLDPGSETWAYKTLAGITAEKLTPTQVANLKAKYGNWYSTIAGVNVTREGTVSGNEWIDTIRGRDALAADMQENIFSVLANADKVPFTDGGANIVGGEVKASLRKFVDIGFLSDNPAPAVTVPKVATVSTGDKQARRLPNVTFSGELAGAIQAVAITGRIVP